MKNKKGMSLVVTSLIIILLVLVAIGIVWVVVKNLIDTGAEDIELNQKCLNTEVKATAVYCSGPGSCTVELKRTGSNTDAIAGVKLVFRDSTAGNSSSVIDEDTIALLGGDIDVLAGKTVLGIDTTLEIPDSVEVTVYFEDGSGNEKLCSQTAIKEFVV